MSIKGRIKPVAVAPKGASLQTGRVSAIITYMDDTTAIHFLSEYAGPNSGATSACTTVYFMRTELGPILNIYGRMVAAGQWHDYAIAHLSDLAVFSIFKRASEMPQYRIIKDPALAHKQGVWRITGAAGQTLKRGKHLSQLLRYFDRLHLKAVP